MARRSIKVAAFLYRVWPLSVERGFSLFSANFQMVRDRRVKRRRMGERGRINEEGGEREREKGGRKENDSYVNGGGEKQRYYRW